MRTVTHPTPYPDVNAVLHVLLSDVQTILETHFTGLYLHGSLAIGDFDPQRSDIDFVIVTAGELPDEMFSALEAMHARIAASGSRWATELEGSYIPLPTGTFDALVSEFIVFPTPMPTEIGQPEMARVLRPGGTMGLTDVILTKPMPEEIRSELQTIGLDYLCDGTPDDFRGWMKQAGLADVEILDFTPVVQKVWERRRDNDVSAEHRKGYARLLEDPEFGLGEAIFYIHVRGMFH